MGKLISPIHVSRCVGTELAWEFDQLSKLDQVDPKFVVTGTSYDDGNPLENKNADRMVARVKQRSFFSKRRQHQVVGFFFKHFLDL